MSTEEKKRGLKKMFPGAVSKEASLTAAAVLKTVGGPLAATLGVSPALAPVVGGAALLLAAPVAMSLAKGMARPVGEALGKGAVGVAKAPFKLLGAGAKALVRPKVKKFPPLG
jgi:hypothetical protein